MCTPLHNGGNNLIDEYLPTIDEDIDDEEKVDRMHLLDGEDGRGHITQ